MVLEKTFFQFANLKQELPIADMEILNRLSGSEEKIILKLTNQKQELTMVSMFDNGS